MAFGFATIFICVSNGVSFSRFSVLLPAIVLPLSCALLQELDAWESSEMVQRYSLLGETHLMTFANQLSLQSGTLE